MPDENMIVNSGYLIASIIGLHFIPIIHFRQLRQLWATTCQLRLDVRIWDSRIS